MIKFEIITLFPDLVDNVLNESIIGRARKSGFVEIECFNIRDYTKDKHRRVDDYPFGGGDGMILQAQPIYDCYMSIIEKKPNKPHCIYMSPQGKVLTQKRAVELSKLDDIVILCGHYEGVDQRALDSIVDEEISIGDYVLTGGELPACVLVDAVCRLVPGVLAADSAFSNESHFDGLLEHPQYTRPAEVLGQKVPEVLISGHHENIEKWKKEQSLEITKKKRPDLLRKSE